MSEDISKKLREACVGRPYARIEWPHRILHEAADEIDIMVGEVYKLREAAAFAKAAIDALKGYEAEYGEPLPDDHELGRIEDSRSSPSFRIRVGHIRRLAGEP